MQSNSAWILVAAFILVVLRDIQGYPSTKTITTSNGHSLRLEKSAKALGYFSISNEESMDADANRIAGGNFAVDGEFPFMAVVHRLIGDGYIAECGGTIISSQWILTAGHCVAQYPRRFLVVVGTTTKAGIGYDSYFGGSGIAMITNTGALHPQYSKVTNDIGLLRLPQDIPFTGDIQPISLATSAYETDSFVGTTVSVIGWGRDNTSVADTQALKYANIPVISNAACMDYWYIDERNICTQPGSGQDACQGDSGGPLVSLYNGQVLQIGVVSYGDKNCPSDRPGVYTRVSMFTDWIQAVTNISL